MNESFADSNLYLTELMMRCPSYKFFGSIIHNLLKIRNNLSSERDKCLFGF